ncbi:metallophosphoesterase family protein [Clostridium butyricum]
MSPNFKFAVLGDSRGTKAQSIQINKPVLGKLLHDIKKYHNPDFILFGGDMILGRATLNVDANTSFIFSNLLEWEMFVKKALGVNSLKDYVFPAIGNHDYSNSDNFKESIKAFNKAFYYLPSNSCNEDMLDGYGKTVYYFDYYNSRFIVLNTVFKSSSSGDPEDKQQLIGITPEQLNWLENTLSSSNSTNNFILLHCPIIGTYKDYYSLPFDQQEALFRIFNNYRIAGVYAGHEHSYNRRFITNVFFKADYALNKSIIQITSGGGGAPFEIPGDNRLNIVTGPACIYEYGIIEVFDTLVKSAFYDTNGTCVDSFIYS